MLSCPAVPCPSARSLHEHPVRRRRRVAPRLLAAAGLAAALAAGPAAPAAAGETSLPSLVPGPPLERSLESGGADRLRLELAAGKHWLIRVEQLGIDVTVEVQDERGARLLAVDSPLGREGTESLLFSPATSGDFRVEVRCDKKGAPAGRYEIRLDELSDATRGDRLRIQAETAVTAAGRLYARREKGVEERAEEELRVALDAWKALGDRRQEARTWQVLGGLAEDRQDYRRAADSYDRALALWRRLSDQVGAAEGLAATLDRLGLAHSHLGDNPQALGELQEALALRGRLDRRLDRRDREAETRNHLCLVLQRLGRFHAAGECYGQDLALARELDDTELEAILLNNLGGIYQNLGEPAKTLDDFQQTLDLRRAMGDELGEGIAFNNLGFYYGGLGEVEEGLLQYGRALAIFERVGNRYWQARTLNNVGFAYLELGDPDRARAYLLRALPLRREVGDKSGEAVTLRNLGRAFADQGDARRALALFRQALALSRAIGDPRGATTARKLLGELQLSEHEPAAARSDLERALASAREMGHRREEAEVLDLLSRAALDLGEPARARELAVTARYLHLVVRDPLGEIAALTALARAERRLGRTAAAAKHLAAALDRLESLHGRLGDPEQRALFLATERGVFELDVDFLMERHREAPAKGYDEEALAVSERARSQSLLALLERAGASLGPVADPELRQRLRDAERRSAAKTRRQLQVLGEEHTPREAEAAEQELYQALTDLDNVRAEIRRRNPRFRERSQPPSLHAAAIRGLLDPRSVLLEYFLGEERGVLWWVTPTSVTSYELPPRKAIEDLARRLHGELGAVQGRTRQTQEDLDSLGRLLLGPVADRLRDQRLVIVPDGALALVPFAALTLPQGREPVLTRHEVVYLPSASVLAAQRAEAGARQVPRGTTPAKTVSIFADPIFERDDPRIEKAAPGPRLEGSPGPVVARQGEAVALVLPDLDRLPFTRREAEAIAGVVPADRRLTLLDGDARRTPVVDGELSGYRILHFATHGVINDRIPELSGLMLSQFDAQGRALDGFVGLRDISDLDLRAGLVVLSGCRTALGKEVRGEGLIGLTRAFMVAGASRVVASLWQVRDQATAELMKRFYRGMLAEHLSPAAALRAAQLSLRRERRFRDPFFWAAFTLQGDWRRGADGIYPASAPHEPLSPAGSSQGNPGSSVPSELHMAKMQFFSFPGRFQNATQRCGLLSGLLLRVWVSGSK